MKNLAFQKIGKILFSLVSIFLLILWGGGLQSDTYQSTQEQEHEIEKAKIFRDIYPLISESDLYCSFFVLDEEGPDIKIIGAEREYERVQFNDGDIVYIDKGREDGLEVGQIFLVLDIGSRIKDFGPLVYKRGRVRVVALEENGASAKVEKSCGQVMLGHFLVPFEEKEGRMGKDLGYNIPPHEGEGLIGQIIYSQREFKQIGSGHWALIDLGENDGIQIGQQLVTYRKIKEGVPLQIFGNMVVIDAQKRTSTIKVLSCKDALRIGDLVKTRTN